MSSSYYSESAPYDNDENEEIETEDQAFSDAIMFAIDCSESMLTETEGEIPLVVALKSVRSTILSKIAGSARDQVGVVLYATRETKNSDKDHVCVMCPMDYPDVPRIKQIDTLIQDITLFREMYGSTNYIFPISDVFSVLADEMTKVPKSSRKRIFLITDNDDPTSGNPAFKNPSIQVARDLSVDNPITLFGLEKPDKIFDTNKFYKDVASFTADEDGSRTNTGHLTSLVDMVETSNKQPRSAFRIPFEIAPGLTIGVKGYNLIIEEKIPTPKKFFTSGEKIEEVTTHTTYQCADTGRALAGSDIKTGYEFGEEVIEFSKDDITKLKTIRDPSLLVLVFKKKTELKEYHQISHPYFIYPDDSQFAASARTFMVLLKTLLKKDQIGICSLITRVNTLPRIVALLPQEELTDPQGNQLQPPGFQLIMLPYADEIRPVPPVVTHIKVEEHIREAAKNLIRKYKIEYNPSKYHNPALLNHKNTVQDIALGRMREESKPIDTLLPDFHYIENNLADEIDAFKKLVGLDNITIEELNDYATPSGSKRKPTAGDDNALLERKAKAANMTIPEMWKAGLLSNATNQYLKDFLTTQSIQPKKLKKDLISQIEDHLSKTQYE